jgi:protein subunit release factor B
VNLEMADVGWERMNPRIRMNLETTRRLANETVIHIPIEPLIPPTDLHTEAVRPHPPGGQHVGYTSTPIKVTHLPTGISATVEMRSQHRSRQIAIEMIEAALTSPNFR